MIETVDVSPDGSQIAYTTGRRPVSLVDFHGSEPRAITTGRSFMLSAAWSPDGSRLAFWSIRQRFEGPVRIGVVDSDGSDQRLLTPRNQYTGSPSWTPDSARIVYHCEAFSGSYGDICVMNADGSSKRTLFGTERDEEDPILSPDGEHLALIQYGGHEAPGSLVVVEAGEGREIFRTDEGTNVEQAEWAPDSERLAYLMCGRRSCRLHVLDIHGGGEKSYEVDEMYDLVWAPDGSAIAFGRTRVRVLDLESGEIRTIAGSRGEQAEPLDWQGASLTVSRRLIRLGRFVR